jgi:hypothetical protein
MQHGNMNVKNVEYINWFGSIKTNDARCTREIKCRFATAEAAAKKQTALVTSEVD